MNTLARALDDLEAELARGRLALDRLAPLEREAVLVHDIRALLGALHFLVRRYHDIIDSSDDLPS